MLLYRSMKPNYSLQLLSPQAKPVGVEPLVLIPTAFVYPKPLKEIIFDVVFYLLVQRRLVPGSHTYNSLSLAEFCDLLDWDVDEMSSSEHDYHHLFQTAHNSFRSNCRRSLFEAAMIAANSTCLSTEFIKRSRLQTEIGMRSLQLFYIVRYIAITDTYYFFLSLDLRRQFDIFYQDFKLHEFIRCHTFDNKCLYVNSLTAFQEETQSLN